jgi:hypothetical protein
MNIYNSPVTKIAFWVIVIGGAACLLIPLFAPLLPLQYLKGYGEIGDAFGGISTHSTDTGFSSSVFSVESPD